MKKYYNPTTDEWYYSGQSMTRLLDNGDLFSGIPTEEQLLSWGFVEYTPPTPPPHVPTLEEVKEGKIQEITDYDQSDAVNDFIWHGEHMWVPYDLRDNYLTTVQSAKRLNYETVPFLGMEIPVDDAQMMLDMVNVYAMRCTAVTDAHKAAVNALETIEEVEAYDYTTGYPEKINFDTLS